MSILSSCSLGSGHLYKKNSTSNGCLLPMEHGLLFNKYEKGDTSIFGVKERIVSNLENNDPNIVNLILPDIEVEPSHLKFKNAKAISFCGGFYNNNIILDKSISAFSRLKCISFNISNTILLNNDFKQLFPQTEVEVLQLSSIRYINTHDMNVLLSPPKLNTIVVDGIMEFPVADSMFLYSKIKRLYLWNKSPAGVGFLPTPVFENVEDLAIRGPFLSSRGSVISPELHSFQLEKKPLLNVWRLNTNFDIPAYSRFIQKYTPNIEDLTIAGYYSSCDDDFMKFIEGLSKLKRLTIGISDSVPLEKIKRKYPNLEIICLDRKTYGAR
jgi:hypothetical protein